MSLILANCIEFNERRKLCSTTENGKTYKINNISGLQIRKVKIDKCLTQTIGEKRCDYLMDYENQGLKRAIFIELKGGALIAALKQLYSTIVFLKPEFKGHQIDARIVGSKDVPGFINITDYKKLAKEIIPTKGTIERGTNKIYEETI